MKKYLYIIIPFLSFLICGCPFDNIEATPPSTDEIKLFQEFPFVRDNTNSQLVSNVTASSVVYIPDPDCNHASPAYINWMMTYPSEFIDITIFDHAGIDPGVNNERAYTLLCFDEHKNQTYYFPLIMRQSPAATEKLFQMTWRLKIDADPVRPENEMGTGLISPSPGDSPFERIFEANKLIGNKWIIRTPQIVVPDYITATITYHLHKLNFVHCN
jgi:hypothetical protein